MSIKFKIIRFSENNRFDLGNRLNSLLRYRSNGNLSITIEGKIGSGKSYFSAHILNLLGHLRVKRATVIEDQPDNKVTIVFKTPKVFKKVNNHISEKYRKMMYDSINKEYEEFLEKFKSDKK